MYDYVTKYFLTQQAGTNCWPSKSDALPDGATSYSRKIQVGLECSKQERPIFSLAQPTLQKHNKPTSLLSVALDLETAAFKRFGPTPKTIETPGQEDKYYVNKL